MDNSSPEVSAPLPPPQPGDLLVYEENGKAVATGLYYGDYLTTWGTFWLILWPHGGIGLVPEKDPHLPSKILRRGQLITP